MEFIRDFLMPDYSGRLFPEDYSGQPSVSEDYSGQPSVSEDYSGRFIPRHSFRTAISLLKKKPTPLQLSSCQVASLHEQPSKILEKLKWVEVFGPELLV